jgi:type IV pilus assembly protein PilQ
MLPIHYAKAKTIAQFLAKNSTRLLSIDGAVEADDRTNLLYIRDHVENIKETLKIVHLLDIAEPQILIKARLVNVDDDSTRALGALFSTKEKSEPSGTPGDFEIPILKIRDSALLEVELSALEQAGHAKTISNPEIMTLSREPAFIESGEEIPYQELTPVGGTTVTFKKAELSLKVVPTLMPNQHILLELIINQDKVSPISINGAPAITTQSLQTQALVLNRQTIVLGGIYEQNHSQETNSIPGLAKIPVAGHLFRHKKSAMDRKELLILITPEIVRAK